VNRGFFVGRLVPLVASLACAPAPPPQPSPVPALPADRITTRLYLIGDAGAPDPAGEPVLQALGRDLDSSDADEVVLFLGDNVYPRGLPPSNHPDRSEAERRLMAQVRAVTDAGATGYFVLGNHDWDKYGKEGWNAARRQKVFVDSAGGGRVSVQPEGGCPGPHVADLGRRLRLVLLDTQWWLHSGPKPEDPTSSCPTDADEEIVDSLRAALSGAEGRLVVVGAHHPLTTGGVHGGYFGLEDHLFPLQVVVPWLWIPLPLIGSLYPTARQHGISSQDLTSHPYQRLIAAFRRAMANAQPALYAAGHEHNLQVLAGGPARLELVSGGGYYGHTTRAVTITGTQFARSASGFGRLDIPDSGPARLAVIEVDRAGRGREVFSTWVE
jgi:Calcineurin-like phosphoesterase